jgi:superfamily II helicase
MIYVYLMDPVTDEDGNVRGHVHQWKDADCENGEICTDCAAKGGDPLGHDAKEANYQEDSTCKRCGVVLGEKLQADMEKYGIFEVLEEDLAVCEYVCPSKINIQAIISDGIELMLKEMA